MIEKVLFALFKQKGIVEGVKGLKVAEYKQVIQDLDERLAIETLREWGLIEPQKLREIVLRKQALRSYRELMHVLDNYPSGALAVRFSDKRLTGFVKVFGGLEKIRNMTETELRNLFFKYYPESPQEDDIVYDILPSHEGEFVFLDVPSRKRITTKSFEKLKEIINSRYPSLSGNTPKSLPSGGKDA
ncbi:MAG: hypothetical protein QW067_12525 [Thermofilaceae archaeon]